MTELTITPKTADKTARFKGAVAAGEHVAVTIKGGAAWLGDGNGEHLSLRVLDLVTGRTLALFPRPPETYEDGDEPEEQDEWDTAGEDDADLFCNLNLNTDRMVNAARHMLRVPVLFVLGAKDEDNPATTRTLYFRDRYIVEFWPERVGDDTPYDLDAWPKKIDEWTELIDGWTTQMSNMKVQATPTEDGMSVTVWDGTGEEPEPIEIRNGRDGEDGKPGQMTEEMTDARIALLATPIAHASNTDLHLRSGERAAWTAKYNKPQGGIPASDLAGAVQTSLGKADTALQEHQSLAAYVNGGVYDGDAKKILLKHDNATVAAIDATAFIRDGMISEVKIVGDNLVVVFNADAGKESISIPLTQIFNPANYYDKTAADGRFVQKESGKGLFSGAYADLTGKPTLEDEIVRTSSNAVKSSGIWAAVWGALTRVPSGISSLYDWCKSFFANAAAIAPMWDADGTYQVGDVCVESEKPDSSGLLYRCKKAYTATSESDAPSHDTEHWDRIDVLSLLTGKQDVIADLAAIRSGAAAGATALQDAPTATETLAAEEYSSPGNSVMVDVPRHRGMKLVIRNALSNTVNTLDTSASGTIATREWVQDEMPSPSNNDPSMDGMAWEGESDEFSRADHVHPTDTSKLSIAGGTRTVTAEDSGGTETYKFAGTGDTDANTVVRVKELPYVNEGEAAEMLVGVYAISSRGVQRHTATSGETSATFGFADAPGTGKIADAILDIDNSGNTSALGIEFNLLGEDYALAVNAADVSATKTAGDVLAEMTSVEANTRARFYFTETAQTVTVGSTTLPVISIQRMSIEVVTTQGGA